MMIMMMMMMMIIITITTDSREKELYKTNRLSEFCSENPISSLYI